MRACGPKMCLKGMCKRMQHIVALRFGDDGTKQMWGLVGSKVWPVSNFAQQFPTTRDTFCAKGRNIQHSPILGFVGQQCCVRLHEAYIRRCTFLADQRDN